jgi:ABC-2 type transport system permease protein
VVVMFVRLKLRMTANNFRGQPWRVALFLVGIFFGLWWAAGGFLLFAVPGLAGSEKAALLVAGFGGGALTLGWVLLPLVFFGVDETLDPARFALLPLRRRTLVTGMVAAALLGIPALATLASTAGLVVSAGALGGWTAAVAQAVGVAAGLFLCVAASRALTSAFATMLRSRRMRDLAAIALAGLAALLGPLQIGLITAAETADWDRLVGPARVVGWTPLAAAYTLGFDVAAGRGWAVPLKLALTLAATAALLWWWSRSLEAAMVGGTPTTAGPRKAARGGAVDQLVPRGMRWMARNRYAALVARETRYWWRDVRRRAGLITFLVVGLFLPVMINIAGNARSPGTVSISMIFVGTLAAVTLANQFGYDGTAYGANVVAGVPGRLELRARVAAFTVYAGPLLVIVAVAMSLLLGEPTWVGLLLGTLAAAYGAGLAANLFVSILAAYALPETSNPFTINTGAGVAKSLLSLVSMLGSAAAAVPMVVAAALLGDAPAWLWLAGPAGVGYGLGAAALGVYLAGDLLDRRMPELLAAVTPRR